MKCLKALQHELIEVLSSKSISTLFQPIIDITRSETIGYEALSRGPSNSPLFSPEQLFYQAELADLELQLDMLCRSSAIARFAQLKLAGKLFLNINPRVLLLPEHAHGLTVQFLKNYNMKPSDVVIELTEQQRIEPADCLLMATQHYRKLGFEIAIDDLGAGYSGLKQWSELTPNIVKIDRYFIHKCDLSSVKRAFINSIVVLAKVMGAQVIAEGIERPEELTTLRQLEVNFGQGYLFAMPQVKPDIQLDKSRISLYDRA